MKVKDIYIQFEGLTAISEKELPVKVALLVQKNLSKVQNEIKLTEEVRQKIISKYTDEKATKEADEGIIMLRKDKLDDFNKEHDELMNQDVEVKLNEISIKDINDITIKPRVLKQLESILTE